MVSLAWLDLYLGDLLGYVGIIYIGFALLLTTAASDELYSMWQGREDCPRRSVVLTGAILIAASSCIPVLWQNYPPDCPVGKAGWVLFGLATAVGIAIAVEMYRYKNGNQHGVVAGRLGRTALIFCYIGVLLSFLTMLRLFESNWLGMFAVLSFGVIVKISDAAAYFVGKLIGRRKLTPNLSPGKTIEGTIGGLLGGIGGSLFVFYVIAPHVFGLDEPFRWWAILIFGGSVTVAGIIGDLAESLLKRESETKDSSTWLPGLGGVLDILDSVMVAAPVAYAFWISGILISD